jgi:hypothetical protein
LIDLLDAAQQIIGGTAPASVQLHHQLQAALPRRGNFSGLGQLFAEC